MPTPKEIPIKSVQEFLTALARLSTGADCVRFFRGHTEFGVKLIRPGIYRPRKRVQHEPDIIREAIIRSPADFPSPCPLFEKLVRLQHYGLPTRLLDITANALAALFFACWRKSRTDGEVIVFDIPNDDIKYFDGDTTAVISNLARQPVDFAMPALAMNLADFNDQPAIDRLAYDIRGEKPAFRSWIKADDLQRVICVRARMDNARIARQDGAFLLFGIIEEKRWPAPVPRSWLKAGAGVRLRITKKSAIIKQLAQCGISEQMLFPELEHQTKYIVGQFARQRRKKRASARPARSIS